MRPNDLVVRCYAEKDGELWIAVCIDYSLAAQGDTCEEARDKLQEQIVDYLMDAIAGDDQEHFEYLLTRKSPFSELAKYELIRLKCHLHLLKNHACNLFNLPVPMIPKKVHAPC